MMYRSLFWAQNGVVTYIFFNISNNCVLTPFFVSFGSIALPNLGKTVSHGNES